MIRNTVIATFLFLCCLELILANTRCCSGPNVLTKKKKCLDGEMKQLSCETRVMLFANESETLVNSEGNLVFLDNNESLTPDKYCFTRSAVNNGDILVFCYEENHSEEDIRVLNVILSFISLVFIVLTISVYLLLVPELLDTQGICLMHSIAGLGFSFFMLGFINLNQGISHHPCRVIAYLMYFSFMYAFFWLNVLCFHIWKMIVKPQILRCIKRWKLVYHLFGMGGPVLLLLVVLLANYSEFFRDIHPGIGEVKCWFQDSRTTFIYFYGPISVLLSINVVYFVWTTVVLCHQMKICSEKKTRVLKFRLLLTVKLFFIMGISWAFEIISAVFENQFSKWVWVVSDAINALQGLLIFLILVVFRKKVLRQLANKKVCRSIRLPASWRTAQDDECEEVEEELRLSAVHEKKVEIIPV